MFSHGAKKTSFQFLRTVKKHPGGWGAPTSSFVLIFKKEIAKRTTEGSGAPTSNFVMIFNKEFAKKNSLKARELRQAILY